MKNLVLFSALALTACGSSPNSSSPVFTATHAATEQSQQNPTASPTPTTQTVQPSQQPNIQVDNAPVTTASPTPVASVNPTSVASQTPVVDDNAVVNANVVADANDKNPNHLSHDPVTGLLDYRYGVFEASQGPSDARSNDGCEILSSNGLLTSNGSFLIFGGEPDSVNNGSLVWIKSTTATYATGTLVCSFAFYPDATGTYTCYRPATATTAACNSTVVLKVIPHTN